MYLRRIVQQPPLSKTEKMNVITRDKWIGKENTFDAGIIEWRAVLWAGLTLNVLFIFYKEA